MEIAAFKDWWQRHTDIFDAVDQARDPADLGLLVTTLTDYIDPSLYSDFQDVVRHRYQELTQPAWPDGLQPRTMRLPR